MKTSSFLIGLISLVALFTLWAPSMSAQETVIETEMPQIPVPKQPVKESRLWLPSAQASHREALLRAARQALLHQDCNEVLYGGLNEFRSEREGISFTILCMRDSRTTFNQVFSEAQLMTDEDIRNRTAGGAAELERLRSLMQQQPGVQPVQPPTTPQEPEISIDTGPPPVLF